jgi:hypothetical protein
MSHAGQGHGQAEYQVGTGRATLYYSEADRGLCFDMYHDEGPGRGLLHVCIEPMPRWYAKPDCSILGPVSSEDRLRVLQNIRSTLAARMYQCVFEDRDGNSLEI